MQIVDKYGEKYELTLLEQNSKDMEEATKIINELWIGADASYVAHTLSTKYSCDGIPATFVVKKQNELVAFCSLLRCDTAYRTDIFPWFGNCYVKENYRRRGLMLIMQQAICDLAKEKGFSYIYLWTKDKELYLKAGWEYIEDIFIDELNQTAFLFRKKLV